LVTGANGHLGANTVRALLAQGHQVVAFVRPAADLRGLAGLDIEYARGDVLDAGSLIAAARGCGAIVHSAAVFRYWSRQPDQILDTVVTGAQNVFAAAQKNRVRRIVYTSSTYAIGFGDRLDRPRSSDRWNEDPHSLYAVAKTQAERAAWRLADETGIPMISLCAAGMWGPYDYRVTPAMRWIQGMVNGWLPIIDTGGSFVDVRDSATAHARAVTMGQPGQRYAIVGQDLAYADISRIITELTGVRHLHLNLGRRLTLMAGDLFELTGRLTGWEPIATRGFLEEAYQRCLVADGRPANEAFELQPRPAEETIADAIRWLLHTGAIWPWRANRLRPNFPPDPTWPLSINS
ncbi:MAG: NAD-dependent epimerase/dehydratase family protein, partial [Chloroflexota bacterium]